MSVGGPQPDITHAPEAHERLVSQTPEPMCYSISEYVKTEQDGDGIGVWTEYQVEDGATVIARGITDRDIAEDIANLPLLRQMVQNGLAARLVPVQRYDQRPDHAVLVSIAQLQEEILAVNRHILARLGQSAESRSSVEIKTSTRGVDVASKSYDGSDVAAQVGPAVDAYFAALKRVQAQANGAAA